MNPKQRQRIPIIYDIEALEFARKCVRQAIEGLDSELPLFATDDRIASRALSELDRLIDQKKAFLDEQRKLDSKAGGR